MSNKIEIVYDFDRTRTIERRKTNAEHYSGSQHEYWEADVHQPGNLPG